MKTRVWLTVAALSLMGGVAYAGFTQPAPVDVDLVNMMASGDQWTARTADNDVDLIGCGIRVFSDGMGGTFQFGFCQATDSAGESGFCSTQDAGLLDAMKATSAFAFITFSWDANDECTRIGFSTQSFYLPNFATADEDDDSDSD